MGRSLGDLSGVALCFLLGFTGAGTGIRRTLEPVTGGVAITGCKVNTRAKAPRPNAAREKSSGAAPSSGAPVRGAIPPLPNRVLSRPDDPRKRWVTTQGPSELPRAEGGSRITELRRVKGARSDWPVEGLTDQGSGISGATGGQSRSNWTPGGWSQSRSLKGWRRRPT